MGIFHRKAILACILLCTVTLLSCEDDEEGAIYLSKKLQVTLSKKSNSVKVSWSLTHIPQFIEYKIYRSYNKTDYIYNYHSVFYSNEIHSSRELLDNSYLDSGPYLRGKIYYWVEATCDETAHGSETGKTIKSNLDSITISNYSPFHEF